MWQGSRDRDNSAVQTAAMGHIQRSAERILVIVKDWTSEQICIMLNICNHIVTIVVVINLSLVYILDIIAKCNVFFCQISLQNINFLTSPY